MLATELTYRDRVAKLAEKKLAQTREKVARRGCIDGDDHGVILPPEDFHWQPTPTHANGGFYGPAGWGRNFRSLMEAHPTYVDPLSALAGRYMAYLYSYYAGWCPDFACPELRDDQARYGLISGIGAPHHFAPDLAMGLSLGFGGILRKIRHHRARHGPDKAEFFQAEEDVVLGIQNWIARTIEAIRDALAAEPQPELRDNLREMLAANEWVVDKPPRSFLEACQWLAWYTMASRVYNGDSAGGQLDELLRPYYQRDLAAGTLDDDKAVYVIACLLLCDPHYWQLGGPAPDGRDLTSRVSFLVLEAAHQLGTSLNLTVRVHDRMDEEFFRTAVRYLVRDRKGWPRFCGDKALVEGFMRNGYPAELARQRIAVGCHWMAIPGREYTLNDCVKINTAKVFEVALWEMLDAPGAALSVAELWDRFADHLRRAVRCIAKGLDLHLAHQQDNLPELALDLLCHGTLEQGLDASAGGVEFYNLCVDAAGLATVADSLAALEQRIEREGALTWAEIAEHLRANYAGPAGERVRLMMKSCDRYGHGGSPGDAWALRVSRLFTDRVTGEPTPGGHRMIPGWFSWSNTITMGQACGATPNGRRAGEPISQSTNPDPGFRRDGAATAMAKAIAAVQCGWGNTCPMQLELAPGLAADEAAVEKLACLIRTHFDLGGTLLNINVLDKDALLAANDDPWKYPDLIVRVTGFTAYFAALSPEFRQLVVDRLIAE